MIRNPYFSRYRQALERSLSAQKSCKEDKESDSSCREDSAEKSPEKNQSVAVEEQLNEVKKDVAVEPACSNVFHGFEQIAPGIFQFQQQAYGGKDYAVPPRLFPPFQSEVMHSQKAGELGFKRIDGLPGPYQNYSTPVFQFT